MNRLLILAYHRVLPDKFWHPKETLAVTATNFEKQLKYLISKKFSFSTLNRLKQNTSEKLAVITFDDGYRDNYFYALPILKKLHIPATFFITTAYLDTQKPYYWELKNKDTFYDHDFSLSSKELKKMLSAGMEIGSHTVNHYELTHLKKKEIVAELSKSKATLESLLGKKIKSVCYPRGKFNKPVIELAKAAGYEYGVINIRDKKKWKNELTLPRVGVYAHDPLWRFKIKQFLGQLPASKINFE